MYMWKDNHITRKRYISYKNWQKVTNHEHTKRPAYKTRKQVTGQGTHKTPHIEDPENDVVLTTRETLVAI